MTRLLIIEDNIKTANYLLTAFKENYFLPEIASDGQEALFLAAHNNYEVIILDTPIQMRSATPRLSHDLLNTSAVSRRCLHR